jgi:hypothetical protein
MFPLRFGKIYRSIALIRFRLGLFPNSLELSGNVLAVYQRCSNPFSHLERPRSSSKRLNDEQCMYGLLLILCPSLVVMRKIYRRSDMNILVTLRRTRYHFWKRTFVKTKVHSFASVIPIIISLPPKGPHFCPLSRWARRDSNP